MSERDRFGMTQQQWDDHFAEMYDIHEQVRWSAIKQLGAAVTSPAQLAGSGYNWPSSSSIARDGLLEYLGQVIAGRLLYLKAAICLGMGWCGQRHPELKWFNAYAINLAPPSKRWGNSWLYVQCFGGLGAWHASVGVEEPDIDY